MKPKIGIATVSTGYNFGSALQAYATGLILESCGYESELLRPKGSMIAGRDVRLGKLMHILKNVILDVEKLKRFIKIYFNGKSHILCAGTRELFDQFSLNYLKPKEMSWHELCKIGCSDDYVAFICGSDQIWNAEAYYVDPFYYLEFAEHEKRIAFAPSFGRSRVPEYNVDKIKEKVKNIRFLSVREDAGAAIIKHLTGRDSEVLVDPTLAVTKEMWNEKFSLENKVDRYMLVYFLDEPKERVKALIKKISKDRDLKIICTPYDFLKDISDKVVPSGPIEFLRLLYNAEFVCTDSFHGTAFSLNFQVPFLTFERRYGAGGEQSSRIKSILSKTNTLHLYEPADLEGIDCNFCFVNEVLNKERKMSFEYLRKSIGALVSK